MCISTGDGTGEFRSGCDSAVIEQGRQPSRIEFGQFLNDEVGMSEFFVRPAGGDEPDGHHSRGAGGVDAVSRILAHHAAFRRDAEPFGGKQEDLWVGLSSDDFISADRRL